MFNRLVRLLSRSVDACLVDFQACSISAYIPEGVRAIILEDRKKKVFLFLVGWGLGCGTQEHRCKKRAKKQREKGVSSSIRAARGERDQR